MVKYLEPSKLVSVSFKTYFELFQLQCLQIGSKNCPRGDVSYAC